MVNLKQLRKENLALRTKRAKEEEYNQLKRENFQLKHPKRIALFKTIGKVGSSAGSFLYRNTIAPPTAAQKKKYWLQQAKLKRKKI